MAYVSRCTPIILCMLGTLLHSQVCSTIYAVHIRRAGVHRCSQLSTTTLYVGSYALALLICLAYSRRRQLAASSPDLLCLACPALPHLHSCPALPRLHSWSALPRLHCWSASLIVGVDN